MPTPVLGPVFEISPKGGVDNLTTLADGTFLATYTHREMVDGAEVSSRRGQVFYADGTRKGDDFIIDQQVRSGVSGSSVTALKDGGFVACWTQLVGANDSKVRFQVFNADGTKGNEVVVSDVSGRHEYGSSVTALDDGGFMIAYETWLPGADFSLIRSQRYGAGGNPVGNEFGVAGSEETFQGEVSLAQLKNGNVVAVFEDYTEETSSSVVLARIMTPDGGQVSAELNVATSPGSRNVTPSATVLEDGRFLVTWMQFVGGGGDGDEGGIRGRIFNADGTTSMQQDFVVNVKTSDHQMWPQAESLPNGGFAVSFFDREQEASGKYKDAIRVVVYDKNGQIDGEEVQVVPHGHIRFADLTALPDGRLIVGWVDLASPRATARFVDTRTAAVDVKGTAADDAYVGTIFQDTLSGGEGDDRLQGGEGGDTLDGGSGVDMLDGGSGNDILDGGAGGDKLRGDEGFDTVTYAASARGVRVELADEVTSSGGDAEGDVLVSIEGVVGSAHADLLISSAKANTFTGGAGNDTYEVDALDTVIEAAGGGLDVVRTSGSFTLGAQLEVLTALGSANAKLTGNELANTLNGNAGANVLDGGLGSDALSGGLGNDTYIVDNAFDTVADTGGIDVVRTSVNYTLVGTVEELDATGSGNLTLVGNGSANTIAGNGGANTIVAGLGNDTVMAGGGNDRIAGGLGNDLLNGGTGRDVFVFDTKANNRTNLDKVVGFSVKDDSVWLENKVFTKVGKGSLSKPGKLDSDAFVIGKTALDAEDRVIYDKATGAVFYDADGSGSGAAVQFASLTKGLKLTAADFFVI